MPLRVYLDTNIFNRQFDDQTQPRIWLETQAISLILQMIETGEVELITSTVVAYENSRNPQEIRRNWVNKIIASAAWQQLVDEGIRQRGEALEQKGLTALDALHLACAEAAKADYFVTCDDRLIRRYLTLSSRLVTVCKPTEFVENVTGE
jgi:predicted nucleic acid-binding protein